MFETRPLKISISFDKKNAWILDELQTINEKYGANTSKYIRTVLRNHFLERIKNGNN